ncbi:alpha/beta fold hydrolase [Bradyrhizobium sp. SYSU BS000235]|uniref:alpha/beta fold hydrolase n=1 Tax=Bradyrhizobium sp. SYSU BS000235 TaxID=3411332 RepID=UPI003C794266
MPQSLPLILVPGLTCSPRIYAPQIPALWQRGPVILANHIRDNTMAGIAKRILDEAPDEFAIAGHSMGGYICLEVMRQAPARVKRLALLSTSASPETPEATERRKGWIAETRAGGYRAILDRLVSSFVHPSRSKDPDLQTIVHDMGDDVGPDAFIGQLEAIMSRSDSRPLLPSIKCPTLILTSDTDNMVPNVFSTELAAGIPGAKLVVIPDCGHLVQLEKPEATTAAMLDWLKM